MRRWAWTLVGLLVIAVAATGFWGYRQYNARNQLRVTVANQYQRSFYELLDSVEDVQISLAKGAVATTLGGTVDNLARVWRQAAVAQSNLSQLPLARDKALRTTQFLNQVSDFAYTLVRKNASGQPLTKEEEEQLRKLNEEAAFLNTELQKVQREVDEGRVSWAEVHQKLQHELDEKKEVPGVDGFNRIAEGMEQYPTLIYDGPFSDHVEQARPKGLTGDEVDEDEARRKVLAFVPNNLQEGATAERTGRVRGRIEALSFAVSAGGKDQKRTVDVDISEKGGHVISMINYRDVDETRLSLEDAAQKGLEFLKSRGFENMVPTYAMNEDNVAIIPYVWTIDDVLIYPDMVKVEVAMDDGEVVAFDGLSYYMSHRNRDLPEPKITEEEAVARVKTKLQVIESRLALIPTDSLKEVLCWEVKGQMADEPYIVYINALTGDEERILKIIERENGTQTM